MLSYITASFASKIITWTIWRFYILASLRDGEKVRAKRCVRLDRMFRSSSKSPSRNAPSPSYNSNVLGFLDSEQGTRQSEKGACRRVRVATSEHVSQKLTLVSAWAIEMMKNYGRFAQSAFLSLFSHSVRPFSQIQFKSGEENTQTDKSVFLLIDLFVV